MKRRKAIGRILLISGGALAGYSGYKLWDWNKSPDIEYLEKHKELIAALAETIIPATDSPGAKEAGVHEYIITMLKDCTERKSQNKFIDGLKEVESYCSSSFSKHYEKCTIQQQYQTLQHFEERGKSYGGFMGKVENKFFGKSFFTTLKYLTAEGYSTSEAGATKGLAYVAIPGKFIGCMPLEKGQRSWATH
ncbi:MAG TPA: gluconate 2-dehydrogenase subunit 3 family protein [Puia sp.]|nr:gluconate 2-dehydrogenase subunit 3 family protein [Puia sp.]